MRGDAGRAQSRAVRVGAQVVVCSIALACLTFVVGWLHLRGEGDGMQELGTFVGYLLVVLALAVVAGFGVLLMLGGWIAAKARSHRTN